MALNAEAIKKNSSQTCHPAIYDVEKEEILLNLLSWEAELKDISLILGRKAAPSEQVNKKMAKAEKSFGKNDFLKKEPKTLNCHYDYTPLGELHETQEKSNNFNVYGIVEKCDFKIYRVGNNLRQILTVSLTDKTGTDFMCSIYSLKDEMCPDIHTGDIIRIHHMQVSKDRSKLKGKCTSFKFILVFSKQNEGQKPRAVAKSLTFTDEDAARVKNLFEWYDKKNPPKLISEVKRGDFVNIICQVIGVYKATYSDTVILKIWDGTKSNEIESSHCGLRDEKLDEKLFLIAKSYCAVFHVFGDRHCTMAAELKPGQYVEVRDAYLYSPKENSGDCKLCLFPGKKDKRGMQVINADDNRLNELKERLGKIIADAEEFETQTKAMLSENVSIFFNCASQAVETSLPPFTSDTPEDWWTSISAVSVTDGHENVKPSSLADVVKHEVPYKFRIFSVVLGYRPSFKHAHELIRMRCPWCWYITDDLQPELVPLKEQDGLFYFHCPDCLKNSLEKILDYTYMFSLKMHDGTGLSVLEVNIWGENAVKFLKGIPPEEVLKNAVAARAVSELLLSVCPNSRPLNTDRTITSDNKSYPILDCSIMSYAIFGQIFYQMFDTKLL